MIDRLRDVFAREEAGIHFFHDYNARIFSQFPSELAMANIHCKHFRRAALQQTISESPGRCANVERSLSLNFNSEKIERTAKFQSTAARELRLLRNRQWHIDFNQLRRFRDDAVPHPYFARHDRALRTLAAFKKSALDQCLIDSRLLFHR